MSTLGCVVVVPEGVEQQLGGSRRMFWKKSKQILLAVVVWTIKATKMYLSAIRNKGSSEASESAPGRASLGHNDGLHRPLPQTCSSPPTCVEIAACHAGCHQRSAEMYSAQALLSIQPQSSAQI
ncbi:hypothetical protein CHARACLAT_001655 [Characodon lateralis]|uniref:Uncharacterized protein n=1 Tax=Characodon lateralis TaxID=208331 RepID=A0ABU7E679_9TELE|nr:hypothetical protein [Characodon lateralis]